MLVRAHKRVTAEGGELRLVIPDVSMLGVLAVTGIDGLIPSFTSLDDALAEAPAVAIRPPSPSAGSCGVA